MTPYSVQSRYRTLNYRFLSFAKVLSDLLIKLNNQLHVYLKLFQKEQVKKLQKQLVI